ncbi:glycosyltransferase [Rhodobacteraceae bacterium NNCM2]|nr:glycosyltransferase [Coraliihabitans acroporae]
MKVAFYAPMKPPCHPTPSGDREIARLTLKALGRAGFDAETVSTLRTLDMDGSAEAQDRMMADAGREAEWLVECLAPSPPAAWVTYHSHYKAPDLVGPVVTAALGVPYLLSEPSISARRRQGPWARFAAASEAAIAHADVLLWTTTRDLPALQEAGHGPKLTHLPAFLDPGPAVPPRAAGAPLRLLTVAMMRPGAKMESYRRLAAALDHLDTAWELTVIGGGDGAEAVSALLAGHLTRVSFLGTVADPAVIRTHCEQSDILLWPGVDEGVGMVWLEAQAAGLPVVAEDGPAARNIVSGGVLAPPSQPGALAAAIVEAARQREVLSARGRAHVEARHSLDAAAGIFRQSIEGLLA